MCLKYVGGYTGADDKDVLRNTRLRRLVGETIKVCAKAGALAPGSSDVIVLKTWSHLVGGNLTGALALCRSDSLLQGSRAAKHAAAQDKHAAKQNEPHTEHAAQQNERTSHLPESPELWVMCGRALHLCGRISDAKRLLSMAISSNLEANTPCPLTLPLSSLPSSEEHAGADAQEALRRLRIKLSSRDLQRLLRECRYEISLIDKLSACLQTRQGADGKTNSRDVNWDRRIQELAQAMNLDSNNLFFGAQALCSMAEARWHGSNHMSAIVDARKAIQMSQSVVRRTGQEPGLWHRPYVVLGECSRRLQLFDAALGNLTRAAELAPPDEAELVAGLLYTLRREKDMHDHNKLHKEGFAGFRSSSHTRASDGNGGAGTCGTGDEHPAFSQARAAGARWNYEDWNKAKWDEEYRAAYQRFTKDKDAFGAATRNKFPWETDHADPHASASPPHPDPFAPPGASPKYAREGGGKTRFSSGPGSTASGSCRVPSSRGFYAILEIGVKATTSEIKKAYMKLVSTHPFSPPFLPPVCLS